MPGWVIFLVIGLELSFTIAIVGVLLRSSWGQLMKYPSKPILDPHVRRNFQSFAIGFVNLGFCVHTVIDDDHLHLIPVMFMKWFGCKPVSIPWSEIQDHPKPGRSRYTIRVKIGKTDIMGPRWCLGNRDILAPTQPGSSS
jgi:hypothetical protein